MLIHDWTRVNAGLFHHFHLSWVCSLSRTLSADVLPQGYFPMLERDRLTPRAGATYPELANRIAIHHGLGRVVAVIEVVSPGNKDSRHALRAFVEKSAKLLRQGMNLMIVDLFPPTARDPQGMHKAIWDEIADSQFQLPPDQPLTVASYDAGTVKTAYVEPVADGDALPEMPLFLAKEWYVPVPLEETYRTTWCLLPRELQRLFDE